MPQGQTPIPYDNGQQTLIRNPLSIYDPKYVPNPFKFTKKRKKRNNPRLLEAYNSLDPKEPFRLPISSEFFLRRILAEATETESVEFLACVQKINLIRVIATQQDWDVFTQSTLHGMLMN